MIFEHDWPWWGLLLAVGAMAGLAVAAYARTSAALPPKRRALLTGLRFLTLLLLLVVLLRPMWVEPTQGRRDAIVPILVDVSRSMRLADRGEETRNARARAIVRDRLIPSLGEEFRVDVLSFGDAIGPLTSAPEGTARGTDLGAALDAVRERYRGQNVPGIVVISDGGDTGSRDVGTQLAPGASPVYTIGVGSPTIARDREVLSVSVGEATLEESVVDLSASVVSHGFGQDSIELRLLENGKIVQSRRVTPSEDGSPVREVFQIAPDREVATLYSVEIPVEADELVPENNSRRLLVPPPGRRRRILLVQGAPGYEHSFLMRAWAQDSGIEADSVVRKGQNERGQETFYVQAAASRTATLAAGFPVTPEALFAYDAVVMANVDLDVFSAEQLAMAADFVAKRGGGLLALGARSFEDRGFVRTPLEAVLPVELTDRGRGIARVSGRQIEPNKLVLTTEGESHPIMRLGTSVAESRLRWEDVPAFASTVALGGPRPGASVLAVTAGPGGITRPLVAVQRYGAGRSMVFTGEAAWRWRMQLPSTDKTYERFWRQAVRWLATAAPDSVMLSVPSGVTPGSMLPINVVVRDGAFDAVRDATVDVTVSGPRGDDLSQRATLAVGGAGRYATEFRVEETGVYRVRTEARQGSRALGVADQWVLVGGTDPEFEDPRRNDEVLRRVATASGGSLLDDASLESLPARLRARAPDRAPPRRRDVWDNLWVFSLVVVLLTLEWVVRRRYGMR